MGYRIDVYTRLSKDHEGQTSTLRQERDARSFARLRGWDVDQVHVDVDTSAYRRGVVRPGYEQLLARVASREVDGVLVWKLDRLVRRAAEFERFWTVAEDACVFLASVNEPIDTTNELGLTIVRVLVAFAQLESATLSMRLKSAKKAAAEAGRPPRSGRRPYGLDAAWERVVPEEAAVVGEGAGRLLAGESLRAVVLDLNRRSIPTADGGRWTAQQLRSVLMSPRVAGLRSHHGEIVAAGLWPALLDEDQWRRVTALLDDPSRRVHVGRPEAHLLSGFARCGKCGHRMRVGWQGAKRRYQCPPKPEGCNGSVILADPADAEIAAQLFAAIGELELAHSAAGPDLVGVLEHVDAELAANARAYADGHLGRDGYAAAARALQERLDGIRRTIAAQEAERASQALVIGSGDLAGRWTLMGVAERRDVLAVFVDHVTVTPASTPGRNVFQPDRLQVLWRV